MSLLRDGVFRAAALAHWAVDLMNSQYPLLLAALSGPLGLSYTLVGILSAIYSLSGSLAQPVFGHWADRAGHRRVATAGFVLMLLTFSVALLLEGMATLAVLILMAVGSAAFHPAAAAEAAQRGRVHLQQQETTAASFFFLLGQAGLFFGPLLGGSLLDWAGSRGLLILLVLLIPLGWLLLRHREVPGGVSSTISQDSQSGLQRAIAPAGVLALFITLVAVRSWVQSSMSAFLPKYLGDLGFRPSVYGGLTSLFMGASAVTGVLGGLLADRYGKRAVVGLSLLLAAPPLALMPRYQAAGAIAGLILLVGGALGVSYSILVVLGQHLFPRREGMASGLVLGFTFASGSIGALLSGMLVDRAGFAAFYHLLAALAVLAAGLALGLRGLEARPALTGEHAVH